MTRLSIVLSVLACFVASRLVGDAAVAEDRAAESAGRAIQPRSLRGHPADFRLVFQPGETSLLLRIEKLRAQDPSGRDVEIKEQIETVERALKRQRMYSPADTPVWRTIHCGPYRELEILF